ncbi:MAG TPA: ubiquitin-like small modifier protein 1 [Natrialbaceae archaeon]|nr:ubiquitin-like small modifier protein 1 [Natrialbaceae archaeon]
MQLHFKFFANYRDAVGQKLLDRTYERDSMTAGEMLTDLETEYEGLSGSLLDNGDVRTAVNVLVNGRDVAHIDGTDTVLEDGDTVSIFPPVAGG